MVAVDILVEVRQRRILARRQALVVDHVFRIAVDLALEHVESGLGVGLVAGGSAQALVELCGLVGERHCVLRQLLAHEFQSVAGLCVAVVLVVGIALTLGVGEVMLRGIVVERLLGTHSLVDERCGKVDHR